MNGFEFIKMEGTGNDYIYLDAFDHPEYLSGLSIEDIQTVSDRRTGIGSDGVVIMAPSSRGDAKMMMWNADGSQSAMCGNALRCVARYLSRKKSQDNLTIETLSGLHLTKILSDTDGISIVRVDMGPPIFDEKKIPFLPEKMIDTDFRKKRPFVFKIRLDGQTYTAVTLSMGNPHLVIFVPDADRFDVLKHGAELERHPAFPERTNVEFVSPDHAGFYQRTFERGSGETYSCGSGACAVLVASVLTEQGPSRNRIRLRGGALDVEWTGSVENPGSVWMQGPAREVFRGRID